MRKKIIYGVCMLGLVALVATSCKKNEEKADSFAASYGTLEAVSIDDDDRAYINPTNNYTFWETGDKIKVFNFENGRSAIYQTEANGVNVGQFVNNGVYGPIGNASEYYSFYPADMAMDPFVFENGVGYQKFTLGATQYVHPLGNPAYSQDFTFGGVSIPQAAKSEVRNGSYFLQHHLIFGVAKFLVRCGQNPYVDSDTCNPMRYVKRIRVTDNHFNLYGTVTMKPNMIDAGELTAMMDRLKNYGLEDPQYKAKWQSYVINELGYSAEGYGKTIEFDYSAMNNGDGIMMTTNTLLELPVCLRPGAFVNGFTLEMDILDVDGEKTLHFPYKEEMNLTFNDYVPADWSNPDHHRMVMEPKKIKKFNLNPGNNNYIDEYINAMYRRDNNIQ
jgi:hypothetical protein